MKKYLNTLALTALFVVAGALTGCVKFKQTTTVMPDGSGKIIINFGMSDQMMAMAQQQGEDPFADMSPEELAEGSEGIVAFTQPEKKSEGGYTTITFAAYFEDINAVVLGSLEDGEEPLTFDYQVDGQSATLTVQNSIVLAMAQEHEPMAPEEQAFAAQMLAGMSFGEHYVLPGKFEAIDGVEGDGQTAAIDLDAGNMMNGGGAIDAFKGKDEIVFKISDIQEDADAMKAFKEELEAAKAEWEKIQQEM